MANKGFPFPFKGQHRGSAVSTQPQYTSYDMDNVRVYDVLETRARGGQRPGLDKWGAGAQISNTSNPVVAICSITYTELEE